ncbi:MAG: M23 family peptidase, partial [Ramlibacter sp.]
MKNGFTTAAEKLLTHAVRTLEHHPRHVTALVAALMLCGGGGAYAVASLGPDAATLPVREVIEAVQPHRLAAQAEALDLYSLKLLRSEVVRATDSTESLLRRLGIDDMAAANFLRNDNTFRTAVLGRAGRNVTAEANRSNALEKLVVRWAPDDSGSFRRMVVERSPNGQLSSHVETAPLVASSRLSSGVIRTSLFASADESRIPDSVATQLTEIFSADIDFHRALHKDDRFSIVYESLEADGEPLRSGRILSAEFVNKGKLYQAVWFQEPGTKGGYYTLDGK